MLGVTLLLRRRIVCCGRRCVLLLWLGRRSAHGWLALGNGCLDGLGIVGTQIVVDAAQMLAYLSATKLIHLVYQSVEELTVVAHDDGCSIEGLDGFLENILRLHVEMVGWLIENQEVDRLEQQLDHRQSAALAATEHLDILLGGLAAKHECSQEIVHLEAHIARGHIVYGLEDGKALV